MVIAIVIEDVPEFVIKGELERKKLFKLFKAAELENKEDHVGYQRKILIDGVDLKATRQNLSDILNKVVPKEESNRDASTKSSQPFEDPVPDMPSID